MKCLVLALRRSAPALCAAALLAACATPNDGAPLSSDMPPAIDWSGIMVGTASRMTLYTYAQDAHGQSACTQACAVQWPPLWAGEHQRSRGDFSILTRPDGRRQWALAGKPLYFYSQDVRPGDTLGEAADNGQWRVFRIHAPAAATAPQ